MALAWRTHCQRDVETWRESYVEDGIRHITVMCKECDAVLLWWSETV